MMSTLCWCAPYCKSCNCERVCRNSGSSLLSTSCFFRPPVSSGSYAASETSRGESMIGWGIAHMLFLYSKRLGDLQNIGSSGSLYSLLCILPSCPACPAEQRCPVALILRQRLPTMKAKSEVQRVARAAAFARLRLRALGHQRGGLFGNGC